MDEKRANFQNQGASIRNSEVQVGQIAQQLAKPTNTFLSHTEINPREEYKVISLRSRRVLSKKTKAQTKAIKEELEVQEQDQETRCACTQNPHYFVQQQ
ncbi:hypothetical protein AHAS_Ahas13G0303300 [Arachis hypogaea]